jgi:hypothetical protein
MDWKRNFLESSLLRRSTNKNNPNEVLDVIEMIADILGGLKGEDNNGE